MSQADELTYAAIITLTLPGMAQPATVTVTLSPPATIETSSGERKQLRDCSLAELQAFADALESELWARYRESKLGELATTAEAGVKITLLDEEGGARRLAPEAWLEEAIVLAEEAGAEAPTTDEADAATMEETAPAEAVQAREKAAHQEAAHQEAAHQEAAHQEAEPEEREVAEVAQEAKVAPEEAAPEEAAPGEAAPQKAAGAEAEEAPPPPSPDEGAGEAEAVGSVVAPPPEETPVISGTAPTQAPAGLEAPAAPEIRIAGLRRPVGHPTPAAVDILINEPVFRNTQAHALTSLNREVAGMLVGPQPEKQPDGRYLVHVTDAIIAKHTRMHGASVTYTPESWRYVTDVIQERYPNEEAVIVGWYHTHPGFGIFLSGMDLFIHQNFFTQKWHVALVLDPLAHKSGFFCWDRAQRAVQAYDFPWPEWAPNSW